MTSLDPDTALKLLEAMEADYPVLHQLIGDDYFTVMGCRYLKQHPLGQESLPQFGEQLSDFLKTEMPYANVPSLAELANFEWALRHAGKAAHTDVITVDDWEELIVERREDISFKLHPSLRILKLDWNATQIWQAMIAAQEVPEPVVMPGFWLVYRKPDGSAEWRNANPLEIAALDSVFHGLTFAELREEIGKLVDEADRAPHITNTFVRSWIEQGLLSLSH